MLLLYGGVSGQNSGSEPLEDLESARPSKPAEDVQRNVLAREGQDAWVSSLLLKLLDFGFLGRKRGRWECDGTAERKGADGANRLDHAVRDM